MLVLVSFGLVLLATILLVVGLLTDDAMSLIYLSIACSATAAVVLWVAFRKARPKQESASEPPTPILPDGVEEPEAPAVAAVPAPSTEPVTADADDRDRTTVQAVVADPDAEAAAEVNPGGTPTADTEPAVATTADDWVDDDDWADAGDFEVEFPIADYDELGVGEIMPLLPQLYSDELEVVAERERSGKNRGTILRRLEELAATGTDADAVEAGDDAEPQPEPQPAQPAPLPQPARPARAAAEVPSLSDDDWDDEVVFPIADYDELTADQVIALLSQLEDDELEDVKSREVAGQGRKSVITEIDRLLGNAAGDDDWRADDEPPAVEAAVPTPGDSTEGRPAPRAEAAAGSVLAISGYDGLTVAEIRPLLAGLSASELRAVLDHEVARDNRRTIVNEIERRLDSADEAPTAGPAVRPARRAAAKKTAARVTATTATGTKKAAAKRSAVKKRAARGFPIDGYESLAVAQIRPLLGSLSQDELRQVREREVSGAGRRTVLAEIDRRLR